MKTPPNAKGVLRTLLSAPWPELSFAYKILLLTFHHLSPCHELRDLLCIDFCVINSQDQDVIVVFVANDHSFQNCHSDVDSLASL